MSATASERHASEVVRDEGSAFIIALVMMLIGSLMVLPMMTYTMAVTRANRTVSAKNVREEAVKAGLRSALLDSNKLYSACSGSGATDQFRVDLAVPPGLGITSHCTTTNNALQEMPTDLRYALTTTQVGSAAAFPAPYVSVDGSNAVLDGTIGIEWCTSLTGPTQTPCGRPYPNSGAADSHTWTTDTSAGSLGGKVFFPSLPPVPNALAFAGGYPMPIGDTGPCTVFFPGRYTDDVVVTGTTPVYFASGIYYFEKTVRFSGDARVVVGAGATAGCADSDAVAVADAIGAPLDAYSSGVGGTFVFGSNGRLMIDTAAPSTGTGTNVTFNRRLVANTDPLKELNDISIMSVNGVWNGSQTDLLDLPGQLYVPETLVFGTTLDDPWTHKYKASTLVSTPAPPVSCAPPPAAVTAGCPIIDINLTTAAAVAVRVAGYVSVPQGAVSIVTGSTFGVNKHISFGGGLLAAQLAIPPAPADRPAFLQIGLLNPVVQKTFKITTNTTSGSPPIVSVALVQVNETGGYAINSWVVQAG